MRRHELQIPSGMIPHPSKYNKADSNGTVERKIIKIQLRKVMK